MTHVAVRFRKHFDYDVKAASDEAAVGPGDEPSMTVQSMAEDADINVLMRRYGVLGKLPEEPRLPMFGDFTGIRDYRSALDAVLSADEAFMELPAEVRARFQNDPQALLTFVEDPANVEEGRKLFGIKAKLPDAPMKVEVVNGQGSSAAGSAPQGAGVGASASEGAGGAGKGGAG